jgi:hypothetical protein
MTVTWILIILLSIIPILMFMDMGTDEKTDNED